MSKKEKIIAICYTISFVLMITSCVFTCIQNKPEGHVFKIEKIIKNM